MLAGLQDALASLATDARVRSRFFTSPEEALAPFHLSQKERDALLGIPRARLEAFAASLLAKRWHEASRVLPLTCKVSPRIGERYRAWVASDPASAHDTILTPGADEALRALPAMRTALARDAAEACYAADLFAFEVLREASRQDGEARFLTSRYAIHDIAQDVRRGLLPVDPDPSPVQLRFDKNGTRWRAAP